MESKEDMHPVAIQASLPFCPQSPGFAFLPRAHKGFVGKAELTGAIGVWQGETLVARVLVRPDGKNGEPVPYIREIDPPPPPSPACGD